MVERFEKLTTDVAQIYKNIQKIKKYEMESMGLKSTQVMCIHYLYVNPQGLRAVDLCNQCREDKAGISRILSDLKQQGFIQYETQNSKKKYGAKARLTKEGFAYAAEIDRLILSFTEVVSSGITEEDRRVFYRVLSHISENLNALCQELDNQQNQGK